MVALLVIATLAAPILALIYADWARKRRRARAAAKARGDASVAGGIDRNSASYWKTHGFKEDKKDG